MSGITGRPTMAHLLLATSFAFGQQWTQLDASGPSSRRNAAAIYDPVGDRMILFGGRGSSGDLGDVWAFDLADDSWERIRPTPRFMHNAVYDATGHRMLIWSGRMVDGSGSTLLNDVWALDLATDQWTSMEIPVARYGTAAIFDPLAGSLVTFAGVTTQGRFDDIWRFDPTDGAWRDVTPASRQPGERCLGTWSAGSARRLWDGRDQAGRDVASGVYLAVLKSSSARRVTRLALLR